MACQNAHSLSLESVPNVARPVVIAAEKDTARNGESDGCDAAKNVIVSECIQFSIGADIE